MPCPLITCETKETEGAPLTPSTLTLSLYLALFSHRAWL